MDVCNRCLFSIPSKVDMAEEQEYLSISLTYKNFPVKELFSRSRRFLRSLLKHEVLTHENFVGHLKSTVLTDYFLPKTVS